MSYKFFALFGKHFVAGNRMAGGGFYRSEDGAAWELCPVQVVSAASIYELARNPLLLEVGSTRAIFMVNDEGGNRKVCRSLDDGQHFLDITPTAISHQTADAPYLIALDPTTPGRMLIVAMTSGKCCVTNNALTALAASGWSTPAAPAFTSAKAAFWTMLGICYVAVVDKVYKSTDGVVWTQIRAGKIAGFDISQFFARGITTATLWVVTSTGTGLYRCQMSGGVWTGLVDGETGTGMAPTGTPTNYKPSALNAVYALAFDPTYMLVAGWRNAAAGIAYTDIGHADAGTPAWVYSSVYTGTGFSALMVDAQTPGVVWAAAYGVSGADETKMGVYKSTDHGKIFVKSNTGCADRDAVYNSIPMGGSSILLQSTASSVAPQLGKSVYPDTVTPGEVARLTIALVNPNPWPMALTADLVDILPSGLVIAADPNIQSDLGGAGIITATAGVITIPSGRTVPAMTTCFVEVDVYSATAGYYANTLAVGALVTDLGSNADAVAVSLTVIPASPPNPPTISIRFDPPIITAGGISRMTLSITNKNDAAADLTAALVDTLPAGVTLAATPNLVVRNLTAGTVTATALAGSLTLGDDGEIPAGNYL